MWLNHIATKYQPQKVVSPHLQWHVTERCNLRCQHCYQDSYNAPELDYPVLLDILDQFRCLVLFHRKQHGRKLKGHITLTGGEPFVRCDFMDLLEEIHLLKDWFSFSILSNGSFIDETIAQRLKQLDTKYFQVSIDGDKQSHDKLRGEGNFDATLASIDILKAQGIKVFVSFTANRQNYQTFPAVAEACRQHDVDYLWSDRMIPEGAGVNMSEQLLTANETRDYFGIMERESNNSYGDSKMHVKMHRALQFLKKGDSVYSCAAGRSLITIMHDGDLLPCRRMPIVVGNVLETPLTKLYLESKTLQKLRAPEEIAGCESCEHKKFCRGGLRCLSYAVHGDPYVKDPGCWLEQG